MIEEWRDIKNYEGKYQASSSGRIKSLIFKNKVAQFERDKVLKQALRGSKGKYYFVELFKHNKGKKFQTARLVAGAFIPNPGNKPQVNHKNLNKLDNRVENLEWCTQSENILHSFANGRVPLFGEKAPWSKLTENQIRQMRLIWKAEEGIPQRKIAKMFNIDQALVSRIVNNKAWKHVKD